VERGNGDPSLTVFGREVTPNAHALVDEFVLFDNFYADAEVSADGHNWSMAGYATDYTEKTSTRRTRTGPRCRPSVIPGTSRGRTPLLRSR